jgi:hypothetical protein
MSLLSITKGLIHLAIMIVWMLGGLDQQILKSSSIFTLDDSFSCLLAKLALDEKLHRIDANELFHQAKPITRWKIA